MTDNIQRSKNNISKKVVRFHKGLKDKTEDFQRVRKGDRGLGKRSLTFRFQDVIDKYGWETRCYLTGDLIKLDETSSYHFDHIVPYSKGGSSTIDNLGIATKNANQAKHDMTVSELEVLCKKILEYRGYVVTKIV